MQILQQQSLRKRNHSVQIDPQHLQKLVQIQKWWRHLQLKKKMKRLVKRMKAKQQIANELLFTQRTYCKNMGHIVESVVIPSKEVIQDEEVHTLLFSTLEQIYEMHTNFLGKLEPVMSDFSHHGTTLSSVIYDELFSKNDFKLKYSNYCANYRKSNQMTKFLFNNNSGFNALLKKAGIQQCNALESELIKPMQRLCKYQLLLNNYFKNMEPDHPDYVDLENVINFVEKLVKETNEQVEQFLMNEKYKQIEYVYKEYLSKIPNPDRKLIFSMEDISLIDMIRDHSSGYKELCLFNDSILLVPVNNCSSTRVIFSTLSMVRDLPNLKYFKNLVQIILKEKYLTIQFKKQKKKNSFLQYVKKTDVLGKNNQFVCVSILGTEVRQSLFKNYTVYIVEVEFSKQKIKKIYPRFKDMLSVQEIIDRKKIKISLPSLSKQTYFSTNKSKTIQKRKILIQQFLQKLLNCKEACQVVEIFKILNLNFKKLGKKIEQQVMITLPNSQLLMVTIDIKNSTITALKQAVSQKLGLVFSSQFQIFEFRNKVKRLMHEDEQVLQIYQNQTSINPFKDNITYLYTRHHYLQPDDQFSLYKNDFVRTQLQLSVIKSEVLKYRLQEQLMITFMCLFALYINLVVDDDTKLQAFIKDICKKQYKVTKQDFRQYFSQVQKRVCMQEDEVVTLPFLIIKLISSTPLYRCQQFQVTVHPKSFKNVKTYIPSLQQKLTLGIKTSHLLLLTCQQKHIMQSFTLDMIQIAQIHPTAIVFNIVNIGPGLRLDTQHAFQISKLINIYAGKGKV